MDVNDSSIYAGKDGAMPSIARNVRILLVDYDKNSLLSLASQFEQQSYKVTTAESADVALSLLKARKNYYNIVIIDLHMPEMKIYEFVDELRCQQINIPVILMAENITKDSAEEALANGVCYVLSKPIRNREIAILWQHIYRVAREMPFSIDTTCISGGSSFDGTARNQKRKNSNLINIDLETKRKIRFQTVEDSNSSTNTEEGFNSKKPLIYKASSLHEKFLHANNILGEQRSQPKTLLRMKNEPSSTNRYISSHLQERVGPVMSTALRATPMGIFLRATPMGIFLRGQTSGTENFDSTAARGVSQISGPQNLLKPPNFMGYTIDGVNEMLDALNNSGNDTVNAIITNRDFQIPKGSGEVQIGPSYGHVIPASNHAILASGCLSNGLEAPNSEPAGTTDDVLLSSDHLINGFQAQKELVVTTGDVILSCIHSQNGLQALNEESSPYIGMGMHGSKNAGNLGEGTSGN